MIKTFEDFSEDIDYSEIDPLGEEDWNEDIYGHIGFEYGRQLGVEMLVGKTITDIEHDKFQITFTIESENPQPVKYMMTHEQDCCESVTVDDIVGDLDDLLNTPVLRATEDMNRDLPGKDYSKYEDESYTWTFYNIATKKGHITIKWYGTSNGYYSERVDFKRIQ
jgi:hypothetical protein